MFPVTGYHGCSSLQSIAFDSGENLHEYCFIVLFESILEIFFDYSLIESFPEQARKVRVW